VNNTKETHSNKPRKTQEHITAWIIHLLQHPASRTDRTYLLLHEWNTLESRYVL